MHNVERLSVCSHALFGEEALYLQSQHPDQSPQRHTACSPPPRVSEEFFRHTAVANWTQLQCSLLAIRYAGEPVTDAPGAKALGRSCNEGPVWGQRYLELRWKKQQPQSIWMLTCIIASGKQVACTHIFDPLVGVHLEAEWGQLSALCNIKPQPNKHKLKTEAPC